MTTGTDNATKRIISELVVEDPSYTDIVEQFVDGLSERVREMEDAIRASDYETLRVAAHRLKGSGGGYGFPILTERAAELERHAKTHTENECLKAFDRLRGTVGRVAVGPDA